MKVPKIPKQLWIMGAIVLVKYLLNLKDQADNNTPDPGVLGSRTINAMSDFTAKLQTIANQVQNETGISARLGMIQAALESAYGASQLAVKANNLFGFKAGGAWLTAKRPVIMMPTVDYYKKGDRMPDGNIATKDGQALKWPAPFRAYPDWETSYRDWARLMQVPMYQADGALAALQADDLAAFGAALDLHYAPNQGYAARLASRADEMGVA